MNKIADLKAGDKVYLKECGKAIVSKIYSIGISVEDIEKKLYQGNFFINLKSTGKKQLN
jgi:hypothetical protein